MKKLDSIKNKIKEIITDPAYKKLGRYLNVNIDPKKIKFHGSPNHLSRKKYPFYLPQAYISFANSRRPFIIPRSFQPSLTLFSNFRTYKLIYNIWNNNFEYTETDEYKNLFKQVQSGKIIRIKKRVISSTSDLNKNFESYVDLLDSMVNKGYIRNINIDDILIWIGPNGELIKETRSGRHRLAAAQLTGIEEIPVRITHIHQRYIEKKLGNQPNTISGIKTILKEV